MRRADEVFLDGPNHITSRCKRLNAKASLAIRAGLSLVLPAEPHLGVGGRLAVGEHDLPVEHSWRECGRSRSPRCGFRSGRRGTPRRLAVPDCDARNAEQTCEE